MKISVRKTRDMELINRLDTQLMGTATNPNTQFIWWIVRVDGRLAGYCGLGLYDEADPYAYLARAGILPEFRGKGIQRRLIKIREDEARKRGYHYIITYTARHNLASANNLIKSGYRLYRPAKCWGIKLALYFCKRLPKKG